VETAKTSFGKILQIMGNSFFRYRTPWPPPISPGFSGRKTAGSDDPAVAINLEVKNRRRKIILFIPRITYF